MSIYKRTPKNRLIKHAILDECRLLILRPNQIAAHDSSIANRGPTSNFRINIHSNCRTIHVCTHKAIHIKTVR